MPVFQDTSGSAGFDQPMKLEPQGKNTGFHIPDEDRGRSEV